MKLAEKIHEVAQARPSTDATRRPEQFVEVNGVKTRVLPVCRYRGPETGNFREVPCCGGKVRREIEFACAHPKLQPKGTMWSVGCASCILAEAPASGSPGAEKRPMISICINSHNEGPRVRATIESFRKNLQGWPHEFVVVADEVTDGGCDNLMPNVTVIRNPVRKGCGQCKGQAIRAACGDVLVFIDAHQNVVAGQVSDLAMAAWKEESIFTPVVRMTEYDPAQPDGWRLLNRWNQVPDPAGLRWDSTKQYRCPDDTWVAKNHLAEIQMVGVGFAVSRKTLERMGGINGFLGKHGSQERGISLRAFMAKVPVKLFGTVHVGHEFRVGKPKPQGYRGVPVGDAALNLWHTYYVVANDEAFTTIRLFLEKQDKRGESALKSAQVQAERRHFHRYCCRRTPGELLTLLGISTEAQKRPDPTKPDTQSAAQSTDSRTVASQQPQTPPLTPPNAHSAPTAREGAKAGVTGQPAQKVAPVANVTQTVGQTVKKEVRVANPGSMGARGYVEPKIDVRIPFEPGARLGAEYNRIMMDSPCDWVLFLDHDVLILHPSWYAVCQEAIKKTPNAGLFTCFTSVCGNVYQQCPGAPAGHDIKYHRIKARELWDKNGYNVTPIQKQLIAGFFMLTSRAAWRKAGGFCEGFLGVDNDYHKRVMKAGMGVYRIDGIYAYHLRERKDGDWITGVPVSSSIVRAWQATRPAVAGGK